MTRRKPFWGSRKKQVGEHSLFRDIFMKPGYMVPDQFIEASEKEVKEFIQQLKPEIKLPEMMVMYYEDQLSYPEIGARVGYTPTQVAIRIAKGRLLLQTVFNPLFKEAIKKMEERIRNHSMATHWIAK